MSKVTDGSYGSHGVPVGADWVVGVQASGPAVKELLLSDVRKYTSQNYIPGGRLTLESGVPISTTDQSAKTTIYYTPFVHNVINLWDGANWAPTEFTETSLALGTITSARPYDVFGYLSGGSLTLELLAWTNDTTRATAVTLQDGRYCKSGDKTRLLLGTFYTTSTTTTEDSGFGSTTAPSKRYLWNAYNRVKRPMQIEEDTASWTWTGTALTWRQWRAATDNQVEAVIGLPGVSMVALEIDGTHDNNTANGASSIGIGFDSTTTLSANCFLFYGAAYTVNAIIPQHAHMMQVAPVGRHYWAMLEENVTAANTMRAYGTVATARRSGMVGWVEA